MQPNDLGDTKVTDWITGSVEAFRILIGSPFSATLSAISVLLLALTIVLAARIDLKNVSRTLAGMMFIALVGSLVSASAAAAFLINTSREVRADAPTHQVSKEVAIANLRQNKEVHWAIRLIGYDPTAPGQDRLSLEDIKKLGRDEQLYTFVADYSELRGRTVAEAAKMVGITHQLKYVYCIIFPITNINIFPASVLGILQVVRDIESKGKVPPGETFDVDAKIKRFVVDDKKAVEYVTDISVKVDDRRKTWGILETWDFDHYRPKYDTYCQVARQLVCKGNWSVKSLMGGIGRDWHPVGASREIIRSGDPKNDPLPTDFCRDEDERKFCEIPEWSSFAKKLFVSFGARNFLVENFEISKIPRRYTAAFESPTTDRIPEICDAALEDSAGACK